MQWFLDGTLVYDTLTPSAEGANGNGSNARFCLTDHIFSASTTRGRHMLGVRVIGSAHGWSLFAGNGDMVRELYENPDEGRRIFHAHVQERNRYVAQASWRTRVLSLDKTDVPELKIKEWSPEKDAWRNGPLKVRMLPGTTVTTLMNYVLPTHDPTRVIEAVRRHKVGDSWALYQNREEYLRTNQPVLLSDRVENLLKHRLEGDKETLALLTHLEEKTPKGFFSLQAGEWENWLAWDTMAVFGVTVDAFRLMTRKEIFATAMRAFKRWQQAVKGHIHSVNGYGLISHLAAEAGEDFVGIETGENIPAAQVQRAFARGAARQFQLPWCEQTSQWFQTTVPSGAPMPLTDMTPNGIHSTYVGSHTGHSPSMLERLWVSAWFNGAAAVCVEASTGYLFTCPYNQKEFPQNAALSEYGKRAQRLFRLMKTEDIGTPYTPFAVLVSKYHGRMTWWHKPWHHLEETTGDLMTTRFFDQLFPGQSRGPGFEERHLCPSPYGDTFDVVVNRADRMSWGAYPVILAVGDLDWTDDEIAFLTEYVRNGGILGLNAIHLNGWDRSFLGLAEVGFSPAGEGKAVMLKDGSALLIRRDIGAGTVFTAAERPEADIDVAMAFPEAFLQSLAASYLPLRVEGDVEYAINQTSDGWALLLANHNGFFKEPTTEEQLDARAAQHVRITFKKEIKQARELLRDEKINVVANRMQVDLGPGEIKLIQVGMK